jgi:subtilisin family serine protease
VGALDPGDVRAPYSNEGPCVDIFAPGTEILSAHKGGVNGNKVLSGTSMAAPFVSGTVALMLEQFPKASVEEIRKMLYRNATQGVVTSTNTPSNHVVHTFVF